MPLSTRYILEQELRVLKKQQRYFFGKSALQLTLAEASLLAGLPKSPSRYNPYRHYDKALQRRELVLKRMAKVGFISDIEAQQAMLIKPELYYEQSDLRTGSYFLDALINDLIKKYGEDVVYHGGIKVFATIDTRLQAYAEASVKKGLERIDTLMGLSNEDIDRAQGALAAIDTRSGAVKAIIGGRNYYKSEFNRAIKSQRQPGSGFKPFLYYSVFKNLGFHPGTIMTDKPVIIQVPGAPDWEPKNFKKTFSGEMVLKNALIDSINTIAAQLVQKVSPESVINTAGLCGIKSPLENVYSIALGTSSVTPFEMASAYSVFANLGVRREPFFFWRVEDAFGRVMFEHFVQKKQVLDPSITYQVVDMMKSVMDIGSGRTIRKMGFDLPAAGKTGTSDHYNDAWFTGFTPSLCTSIWIGFDKNKKLIDSNNIGITGGRGAAPIWADFMIKALKSEPKRDFLTPEDIRFETMDPSDCNLNASAETIKVLTIALKPDQHLCERGSSK